MTTRLPALALIAATALAARSDNGFVPKLWPKHEFDFARLYYEDYGQGWPGGSWKVDYPDSEYFFTKGVGRLSRIEMGDGKLVEIHLEDDSLFNYPWLYAVEVGYWHLDDFEASRLREYLLRGGFLVVDDFHGPEQWIGFTESMHRVFPDRPIVDLPDNHEIFHAVYDVDQKVQIPGIRALQMNVTYEYGGKVPHWRGIYDDKGRLMVMINHNMDLGDAWELADDPDYPQKYTTLALHFAVNYAVYAMTH